MKRARKPRKPQRRGHANEAVHEAIMKRLAALHLRPSCSADGARAAELARLRALTPFERMAEALELGEDELSPPGAPP